MKVHEYQAKAILSEFGIPIPKSGVASSADEAANIAREIGNSVVVKAQIHAGGRGLAGGVKIAASPEEAHSIAASLLGQNMVTNQTSPDGAPVRNVLIEEPAQVSKEYYLAIIIDSVSKCPVVMASEAGGMEIEEVANTQPEKILRAEVNPTIGLQPFQCRNLAYGMNLPPDLIRPASTLISNLYKVFEAKDCSLAEINPLAVTNDNQIVALDAKLDFDDDALARHPEIQELQDTEQQDPLEVEASQFGISYVKLDGDVGCMVNGAGLAMATMDAISMADAMPANFLDVGGGASEEQIAQAFKLLISDKQVQRILVNVFGGILRCDVAARGIVAACNETNVKIPVVVRMLGTNAEEGRSILKDSGLDIIQVNDLNEAAEMIKRVASDN